LIFSIDLPPTYASASLRLERIVRPLRERLEAYRLPATWVAGDPESIGQVAAMRGRRRVDEVSVRLSAEHRSSDRTTNGSISPARWDDWAALREQGLPLKSCVTSTRDNGRLGQLMETGVVVIRPVETAMVRTVGVDAPRPLREGLWSFPLSGVLPANSVWKHGRIVRQALASIRRIAVGRGWLHFAIDAARLSSRPGDDAPWLDRLFACASEHRRQGRLKIVPLGQVPEQFKRTGDQPSDSILRRAA
jgi:hypothetical protein